jgi:hypothetical protein
LKIKPVPEITHTVIYHYPQFFRNLSTFFHSSVISGTGFICASKPSGRLMHLHAREMTDGCSQTERICSVLFV